jgi:hypothetical protein
VPALTFAQDAVLSGLLPVGRVAQMLTDAMAIRFRLGLFDPQVSCLLGSTLRYRVCSGVAVLHTLNCGVHARTLHLRASENRLGSRIRIMEQRTSAAPLAVRRMPLPHERGSCCLRILGEPSFPLHAALLVQQ